MRKQRSLMSFIEVVLIFFNIAVFENLLLI